MSKDFEILDRNAVVEGKSVSAWTAEWWKWVGERSIDENPLDDPTGKYATVGNDDEVFFVAGPRVVTIDPNSEPPVIEDGIVERKFHIPSDTPVLVPIMNVLSFDPIQEPGEEEYDPVSFYMERFEGLYARIDGKEIEGIKDNYQVASPDFQLGPAEEGTVLYDLIMADEKYAGKPADAYAVGADGYWLMLDNLSNGKHTLEFGGFFDSDENGHLNEGDIYMAVKDKINVVGPKDKIDVVGPEEHNGGFDAEIPLAAEMLIA
jgi:hypothetical protein